MIRPVFGVDFLGINTVEKNNFAFDIYPNPLRDGNLQINLQSITNKQKQRIFTTGF